jgi:uncharacterized protein
MYSYNYSNYMLSDPDSFLRTTTSQHYPTLSVNDLRSTIRPSFTPTIRLRIVVLLQVLFKSNNKTSLLAMSAAPSIAEQGHSSIEASLVTRVQNYVKEFMNQYDGSHDYAHVERVLGLALSIASTSPKPCDFRIVTLSALLHDVGDSKYLRPGENAHTMVQNVLLSHGADAELASKVQTIVGAVSYSHEIANPDLVQKLLVEFPELGIVQDADRLDALGAVGIGRLFTFGGAKGGRALDESIKIIETKLKKLESMMKTDVGRDMARDRTRRLMDFKAWWADEQASAKNGLDNYKPSG